LSLPIPLEIAYNIVLVEVALVNCVTCLVFDPSLNILVLYFLGKPASFGVLLEINVVLRKVKVAADSAKLNTFCVDWRQHEIFFNLGIREVE
jgi:hypothetical protein